MLPYPTHAHPTMSAHRHANSQPNSNDLNSGKPTEIPRLTRHFANVCVGTRVWCTTIMKIKVKGLDGNTMQKYTQLKTNSGG